MVGLDGIVPALDLPIQLLLRTLALLLQLGESSIVDQRLVGA